MCRWSVQKSALIPLRRITAEGALSWAERRSRSGSSVPRDDVLLKGAWKPMLILDNEQKSVEFGASPRKGVDAGTRKALEGQKRTKRVKMREKTDLAQAE
ncbi:hypothetical protein L596_004275 [Steinernema carpocapsae]|uniref:Uncharacterized protein n=1 Tax=Steinernema carpocapsae TaxID=34508 RepID=A0A4U8UVF2_STECR|nr:hypothetical protein L596_004275 [Steinernema carpocapsae]